MKKLILITVIICTALVGKAQTDPYGPLPYRTLEQTIGEDYYILPFTYGEGKLGYTSLRKMEDGKEKAIFTDLKGTIIKLINIDNKTGHFKDANGNEYVCEIDDDNMFNNIIPFSEIANAKKLLLHKTVWLNSRKHLHESTRAERFDPVVITDIQPGAMADLTLHFFIKTATGQTDSLYVSVSGTNTQLKPEHAFTTYFLTENPKLKYHFTPAVWEMVKAGYTEIGMPMDAFRLVMGFPKDIHTTTTAKGSTQQWVYGTEYPRYYYFANGKLTAKQE